MVAGPYEQPVLPVVREGLRWVPYPANAVEKHRALHAKLAKLRDWANESTFNRSEGQGRRGVIGAGFAFEKLLDLVGNERDGLRLFKLGTIYPAPERAIAEFLENCDAALVLEENEPYLEMQIKALAHGHRLQTRILGKLSGHVSREGELFRWQIQQALERFLGEFYPVKSYTRSEEAEERPGREDHCAGCPYPAILWALREVGHELDQELVLVGDPGCLAKAAHLLDAKYAMGSAAAVAQGMTRAELGGRALAIFGDSAFFHTGVTALINAVHNQTPILMIVLDNSATVTSGFQPNAGSGLDARGGAAPKLSIEGIARACGVEFSWIVGPDDGEEKLRATFREGIKYNGLGLIVVRKPCKKGQ
jgi:indolepyruvate ferredoxin oxidoreductase alpha subunit